MNKTGEVKGCDFRLTHPYGHFLKF